MKIGASWTKIANLLGIFVVWIRVQPGRNLLLNDFQLSTAAQPSMVTLSGLWTRSVLAKPVNDSLIDQLAPSNTAQPRFIYITSFVSHAVSLAPRLQTRGDHLGAAPGL